ncbi:MAG: hypothetical protein J0L99_21225 [Chitinophagales bacterium]|nr:hypothetical protein [Chitinophagales bacterium]
MAALLTFTGNFVQLSVISQQLSVSSYQSAVISYQSWLLYLLLPEISFSYQLSVSSYQSWLLYLLLPEISGGNATPENTQTQKHSKNIHHSSFIIHH